MQRICSGHVFPGIACLDALARREGARGGGRSIDNCLERGQPAGQGRVGVRRGALWPENRCRSPECSRHVAWLSCSMASMHGVTQICLRLCTRSKRSLPAPCTSTPLCVFAANNLPATASRVMGRPFRPSVCEIHSQKLCRTPSPVRQIVS